MLLKSQNHHYPLEKALTAVPAPSLLEKAIANRMLPALQQIIDADQRGFLPNR